MMMPRPTSVSFFRRRDNARAAQWERKLTRWLRRYAPEVHIAKGTADIVIVLGGDGAIIEAARTCNSPAAALLGLNLGTVGFLASVRTQRDFISGLRMTLRGNVRHMRRMMLDVSVRRSGKAIFQASCLNEVYIQNPLGMVGIDVRVNGSVLQRVQGMGLLIATPTGSTGYNLSAHGPIVDPSLDCMIVTEILDHNLPTPSIVLSGSQRVTLQIRTNRQRGMLTVARSRIQSDVLLAADGQVLCPILHRDMVTVRRSVRTVSLVEVERNYFSKSLHEKFSLT